MGTDFRAIFASLKMITFKIQMELITQNKNLFALYDMYWNTQSKNLFEKGVRFLWRREGLLMTCTRVCGATDCQFKSLAFFIFCFFFFQKVFTWNFPGLDY